MCEGYGKILQLETISFDSSQLILSQTLYPSQSDGWKSIRLHLVVKSRRLIYYAHYIQWWGLAQCSAVQEPIFLVSLDVTINRNQLDNVKNVKLFSQNNQCEKTV
mgnify:CR=1 FL=1